ncbi:MAG: hypothetical protein WCL51_06110 [Bacteroidota bacterium]
MKFKTVLFAISLIMCLSNLKGQELESLSSYEDSLKILINIVQRGANDNVKFEANEKFTSLLEDALAIKKSFDYPFDSLKTITNLISTDKKFRIFNWAVAKSDGNYIYYGFIQVYNSKKKKYEIYPLTDKSEDIQAPEFQFLDNQNWYGAMYFKIIHTSTDNNEYYTLLGWDGNDGVSYKKIIEVLTFKANSKPFFGASIFKKGKEKPKRIIFEYSAQAIMTVRYEEQHYNVKEKLKKPIKGQRFELKPKKAEMIVCDRLAPLSPDLEGQRQFYVPETNLLDAFIFENGKWVFIEDVDARNPVKPKDKITTTKKIVKKQLYNPAKNSNKTNLDNPKK